MTTTLKPCALIIAATATLAQAQLELELFASGLQTPVFVTHAGDGSGRVFVIEQQGVIRVVDSDGAVRATPFLDIDALVTGGFDERGLLGLAFHPDYASNGKFYVNYTDINADTRVVEYRVSDDDPNVADPESARRIMFYDQPGANHNGGWIGFGPDGYLYIASGDGGASADPGNLTHHLGKMHRIDVDGGDDLPDDDDQNYAVPSDNPYASDTGVVRSTWASGLRNPWRNSFDRETGDLWIGDVGQWTYEEINFQAAGDAGGQHYGWRCREGFHATAQSCGSATELTDPVFEYTHGVDGCSVIGGYAYRGCALGEEYKGLYFFSDYCSGRLWTLDPGDAYARTLHLQTDFFVSSLGEDEDGELYIAKLSVLEGAIYKIVNAVDGCAPTCPADLTGDGSLDFFDVSAFLNGFNNQDPDADFTGDGSFDFFDVSAFLTAFVNGCP